MYYPKILIFLLPHCYVKVMHSQKMSKAPTSTWIISEESGKIVSVHCDCMAGLGESCSHVGAILFYIEAAVLLRDSKTVTGEKHTGCCTLHYINIEYKRATEIDFHSPQTLKAKLDCKIDMSKQGF